MSSSELPPLRPLTASGELILGADSDCAPEPTPPEPEPERKPVQRLPWEARVGEADTIGARLREFCREAELVYSAIVEQSGEVCLSVCTVGSLPHNEQQIGELVSRLSATSTELGEQVGEHRPQGLNLQGSRWSYSLDPISDERFLFAIYPAKALPAIVRAGARKVIAELETALDPEKNGE